MTHANKFCNQGCFVAEDQYTIAQDVDYILLQGIANPDIEDLYGPKDKGCRVVLAFTS